MLKRPLTSSLLPLLLLCLAACSGAPELSPTPAPSPITDGDEDGYAAASEGGDDCNDNHAEVHPGAAEQCNGLDDDCDGATDEGFPTSRFYTDADGDGYGDDASPVDACVAPPGSVSNGSDCDDGNTSIHPEAVEICDNIDQDCDEEVDEDVVRIYYVDADGDGYGNGEAASPVEACVAPPGSVSNGSDCDDDNPSIHPNASDLCDGIDQDCDGEIDEDVVTLYYVDADEDGYGDETLSASCLQTETSVTRGGDCDDDNASSYPAAPDTAGDGIDQSCDGIDGLAPSVGLPGSSFTSIQAALDAASDGQTVWVGPGTYNEYGLNMQGKALRLASTAGQETTILDGRGLGTVFYFDSAETETSSVEGFTVTGGEASCNTPTGATSCSYAGGGMFLDGSSPTLNNVTFAGNWTSANGPGDGYGGGMYLDNSSPTLSNVTFTGNGASGFYGSGGGMYLDNSSPTLKNVTFTGNEASGDYAYGGGMWLYSSSPTLSNVTFTGNEASGDYAYGGGMWLYSSSPTLSNVTFTGNEASGGDGGYGGGMSLGGSSPTLSNVTFTGNTADDYGGGMRLYNSSPTLSNVTFTGNTAEDGGGGMYLEYSSSPTLDNVTFTGNLASGNYYSEGYAYGGGMAVSSSSPTLSNVTFTGNTAEDDGGGMYLYESSPTLSNVTFTGNTADDGGGMYLDNSSPTLKNVTFTGNTADYGGGMYLYDSSPTLSNVTFTGNTAEDDGGGMYLYESSPTLKNVTFTGNTAEDDGGGMYLRNSSPTLKNVTFTGNTASGTYGYGGGMYLDNSSSPTLTNVILAYNTGLNLYVSSGTPVLSYTNLYQAYGPSHNLTSLPPTVTELEPGFVSFSPDGEPSNDDLHLQPSSPLRDAGDPRFCTDSNASGCDPDGSLPDLGAYGGPQADFSGYQDSDQDGLYDSWELALAGNLTTLSGALDADADGLSDEDELKAGTSPVMTDSDADGSSDGNEVAAGKDPLNPSSVPGVEGLVALQVPSSAYPTLQAALNAIPAGREGYVKLAAGTLKENLTLSQKSVTVEGAGEGQTVLDGQQHDSVWKVGQAELNLSGVTVQNGKADFGGGMSLSYSSPTLSNVTFTGNTAVDGGGMYLSSSSSPTLSNVTFTGNEADYGGGMYLSSSSPTLSNVTFTGNTAEYGGGMYLWYSSPTLSNVTFTGNTAEDGGGGMYLYESSPTLSNVTFTGNTASGDGYDSDVYGYGGGMYLYESSPTLSNVTFTGNTASGYYGDGYGGGMYLYESSPTLKNVTFTGNTAYDGSGGGMFLDNSSPTLKNVTFTGNTADYGGGMYLDESSPTLSNVILAYNTGLNLYVSSGTPVLSYTNLYQAYGPSHNLTSLPPTVTELEPRFVSFSLDGDPSNDDLHLQPSSPLRDAGDPRFCTDSDSSGCDPDGSLPDLGAYGGPQADFSGYQDSDQDGLYDSWELAQAGNLTTLSGALDADADGLSDEDELKAGTSPVMTDSDADGSSDGNEVAAGKDPLNPSSVPGVEGLVALQVPSSAYPTLQAALNAIPAGREGYVKLAAGTLKENLTLSQKSVTVEGAGEGQTVLDGQQRDSVWKVGQAELNLSGVTVQNGKADSGGGMWLYYSSPTLSNVTFTGNTASYYGGGMYLDYSDPTLSNVTFTGNTASSYYGGGMYLSDSSPTLSNVTFTGNTADYGGGMYLDSSSPTLSNVTFTGNTASNGGGMSLYESSPTLSNVTFTGNTASNGGGMSLYESSPTLSNVTFTGNSASGTYGDGGGMSLYESSPTLSNVTFTGNTASYGGGMDLYESSPTLKNVTFTGNTASYYGGGMYLDESSPTLKNVILAYNRALQGGNFYIYGSSSSVNATTSLFYNPSGWGRENLTPTGTYLTVEPKFLDYADTRSGASCTPGTSTSCLPSDLHPALGSPLIDAGDPAMSDVDGSRADIGSYGGPGGGSWDVDADGAPDYFWPGEWDNAPSGFDPADYDCDDLDPDVQGC